MPLKTPVKTLIKITVKKRIKRIFFIFISLGALTSVLEALAEKQDKQIIEIVQQNSPRDTFSKEEIKALTEIFYMKNLKEQAQKKNPKALYFLSEEYRKGIQIEKNEKHSMELLEEASRLGFAPASQELGIGHLRAHFGLNSDSKKGMKFLNKAAEQSMKQNHDPTYIKSLMAQIEKKNPKALYLLAQEYMIGEKIEKNKKRSMELLEEASYLGLATASYRLAEGHIWGDFGFSSNPKKTSYYMDKALQQSVLVKINGLFNISSIHDYEILGRIYPDLDLTLQMAEIELNPDPEYSPSLDKSRLSIKTKDEEKAQKELLSLQFQIQLLKAKELLQEKMQITKLCHSFFIYR